MSDELKIRLLWSRWSIGGPPSPESIPVGSGNLLQVYELMWAQGHDAQVFVDIMQHHGGDLRRGLEIKLLGAQP